MQIKRIWKCQRSEEDEKEKEEKRNGQLKIN